MEHSSFGYILRTQLLDLSKKTIIVCLHIFVYRGSTMFAQPAQLEYNVDFFFFFSLTILSSSGRKIYEKNLVSWSLFHSDILIRKKSFSRVRAMDYCRLLYYIILPPYSQVLWSIREKDFRLQMYCMHNKLGTISF